MEIKHNSFHNGEKMRYKLSRYNYCIQREHTIYVCNFFSGAFIQLNSMEYEKIFCEKSFEYDNELCSELVSNGILIPFYANEKQQIDKKRAKYILENNTSLFRILPTWRCNEARLLGTDISIIENKETGQLYVSMPSYRTKQFDDRGKPVYQDVCFPITKAFRDRLYGVILNAYQ